MCENWEKAKHEKFAHAKRCEKERKQMKKVKHMTAK
jgi:hypothetical protein